MRRDGVIYRKFLPSYFENADWRDKAACKGLGEVFFSDNQRAAKEICKTCPVKKPCLNFAVEHNEAFWVWGGKTEKERWRAHS